MLLDTPLCDFGWKAPSFELPDAQGKLHKLEDYAGENGTLVAFICNHCPYVIAIIERLVEDAKALQSDGVNVIAVMANDYQAYSADAPDKMIEFAAQYDLPFPYLVDEAQEVARAYDAVCTPDFFGFNADFELQYRGRLDASKREAVAGAKRELLEAMQQVAKTGKGPADQIASMGCSIKWRSAA